MENKRKNDIRTFEPLNANFLYNRLDGRRIEEFGASNIRFILLYLNIL